LEQGFAIGNGLTDPAIQYKAYTDYALDMGIIKQAEHDRINKIVPACEVAIKLCGNVASQFAPIPFRDKFPS
jgi:serine carboxypeptidase-like clade 4